MQIKSHIQIQTLEFIILAGDAYEKAKGLITEKKRECLISSFNPKFGHTWLVVTVHIISSPGNR